MKKIIFLSTVSLLFLTSCKESKKNSNESNNTVEHNYIKIDNKVDSTLVKLSIKENKIEGQMLWLPFEKDRKVGILHGTKNENGDLSLIFDYYQEGALNSDSLVGKLMENSIIINGDTLKQTPQNVISKVYTPIFDNLKSSQSK